MKKTHRILSLIAGISLISVNVFAIDNLVLNPSFEQSLTGAPRYFYYNLPSVPDTNPRHLVAGNADMISLDPVDAKSGSVSVKLSSATPVRIAVSQSDQPCVPGLEMRLSVWMKGQNLKPRGTNPGALVRLGFANRKDPELNQQVQKSNGYLYAPADNFDWTHLTANVIVPEGVDRTYLECFLWESSGTVWFDDLTLEPIGGPVTEIRPRDPDGLLRYRQANTDLPAQPAATGPRVIFYGDSITDVWKLDQSFPGKNYINRGIGGQDTAQMRARLEQDVLNLKPDVVWFLGGTNDIAKGFSNEATLDNVNDIARICREHGIRLIICSILPVSDYHEDRDPKLERSKLRPTNRILEINQGLRQIAAQEKATYLDLYNQMVDASGQMPAEWSNDGLHPNSAGYAVMAPSVAKAVELALPVQ